MASLSNHPALSPIRNASVKSIITQGVKAIGTHHGSFHCDEALAVSLLKTLPDFANHEIIRTRDPKILEECDIVVDVGGEYDASRNRFDHHQKEFNTTFEGKKTKLSSAGLVYKHFGKNIIENICSSNQFPPETIQVLYQKMYSGFIEHIDAIDNGIEVSKGEIEYKISTTLSNRVSFLNPRWNEDQSDELTNKKFLEAMILTSTEFLQNLLQYAESWLPARKIVEKAVLERFQVHVSGEIILLDQFCPWKSNLYDIEEELLISGQVKYAIYQDTKGSWRVQCVGLEDGGFANRMSLPSAWRGLRDQQLIEASSIPGGIFVHAAGFIGGNETKDGALQMAIAALAIGGK